MEFISEGLCHRMIDYTNVMLDIIGADFGYNCATFCEVALLPF
jgi:hypothetical protein